MKQWPSLHNEIENFTKRYKVEEKKSCGYEYLQHILQKKKGIQVEYCEVGNIVNINKKSAIHHTPKVEV